MRKFFDKLAERIDDLEPEACRQQLRSLVNEASFFETTLQSLREGVIVIDSAHFLLFANAAAGDYRPSVKSPLREAALPLGWMVPGSTDLDGSPRLVSLRGKPFAPDALPDIGCYECQERKALGTVLLEPRNPSGINDGAGNKAFIPSPQADPVTKGVVYGYTVKEDNNLANKVIYAGAPSKILANNFEDLFINRAMDPKTFEDIVAGYSLFDAGLENPLAFVKVTFQ